VKSVKAILGAVVVWVLLDVALGVIVPDRVMNLLFVAVMSVLLTGVALVAYGTLVKNRWGLNMQRVNCPRCGQLMPTKREGISRSQRLWGGATCTSCGCDMDKWGREIVSAIAVDKSPYRK
jgi:hypothetical protein